MFLLTNVWRGRNLPFIKGTISADIKDYVFKTVRLAARAGLEPTH